MNIIYLSMVLFTIYELYISVVHRVGQLDCRWLHQTSSAFVFHLNTIYHLLWTECISSAIEKLTVFSMFLSPSCSYKSTYHSTSSMDNYWSCLYFWSSPSGCWSGHSHLIVVSSSKCSKCKMGFIGSEIGIVCIGSSIENITSLVYFVVLVCWF